MRALASEKNKRLTTRGKINTALAALVIVTLAALALSLREPGVAAIQNCVPPPPNLVSWYPASGNGNDVQSSFNGALQAGATFMPGRVGQAFSFDGASGVVVAHHPNLNPANLTLDAWVNPTALNGDVEIIVNKENNPFRPSTTQYEIGIRGMAAPGGSIPVGNFCFFLGSIAGLPDQYSGWVDGGAAAPLNTWTHVALTFDGTTARAYVNGALTRTLTGLSGSGANSTGPLKIGSRSTAVLANNPGASFNGLIDEVEIFSRALAQAELQAIYNAGSAGKCLAAICARPNFLNMVNFPAQTGPAAVATADFNNDGRLDIATANYASSSASVLLNAGNGNFALPNTFTTGVGPQFIAAADLRGSGNPDLIVVNGGASNLVIFPGNGNGTFGAPTSYTVGNDPRALAVGDYNNDGRPDLATANVNAGTVTVLLNNGVGVFSAAPSVTMGAGTRFVLTADFDADGRLDLAAANRAVNNVSVALGNGNGTFNSPTLYAVGNTPQGLTLGDFNSDGYLDLAASNTVSNNVSIILNNGNGTFGSVNNFTLLNNSTPASIIAGDYNSDGKLDLLTSNYDANSISVLLGNGLGGFTSLNNFDVGKQPQHLAPGDFNNDGRLDLVTSNLDGGNVTILTNNCTSIPLNTPPTITLAGSGVLARQQGSFGTTAAVATVSDPETIPNNLVVTASAPPGISVTNLVNNNGVVSASIAAACNAAVGPNTVVLIVTDGNLASNTANLTINVVANNAPTLAAYPSPPVINVGDSLSVQPAAPPSDNGTITGVTVSAAAFTGTLSVNPVTGVVTVSNARPAGAYAIVVTATDNCGATSTRNITLFVGKLNTNVALSVAPGIYIAGQPVTFTATVTAIGAGGSVPTGSITFFDGTIPLGTSALNAAGQAVFTTTLLPVGTRQITAFYGGDTTFNSSTSATVVLSIARGVTNVSAASYRGETLAQQQIIAAFGSNLATSTQIASSLPLPTNLAGTIVRVRDSASTDRLAALFFVSPGQVNYLLPAGTASGAATVTIIGNDGSVSVAVVQIEAVAPGLFSANASGRDVPAGFAVRVRADGSATFEQIARFDNLTNAYVPVPIDLGPEVEQVFLALFGTGFRGRSALSGVLATVGGASAEVTFAGAQGELVGLDQTNIRIPRSVLGRGEVDVVLTVDGKTANTLRVNIR
jgi:uncharacterized protein (TIGR03437 family)